MSLLTINPTTMAMSVPPDSLNSGYWLDAAGEKLAMVFQAPKAGTLRCVEFNTRTVTTAQDLRVSFQDVSLATGYPDGTVDQYRVVTAASQSTGAWIVPGVLTADGTDGGAKRTVAAGDWLCFVIEFNATTGNIEIGTQGSYEMPIGNGRVAAYTGSWAAQGATTLRAALVYDDGTITPVFTGWSFPFTSWNSPSNFTAGTVEQGNFLIPPFGVRVCGVHFVGSVNYATGSAGTIVLYDSGRTVLTSQAINEKAIGDGGTVGHTILFTTPVTLTKDATYRLVAKATGGTVYYGYLGVARQALFDLFPDPWGQGLRFTAWNGSAWTDYAQSRMMMYPIIDGIEIGGGSVTPGNYSVRARWR